MIMLVFALEPLLEVETFWSRCDLDLDFMAVNGHETVSFKGADTVNAVGSLVLLENIFQGFLAQIGRAHV